MEFCINEAIFYDSLVKIRFNCILKHTEIDQKHPSVEKRLVSKNLFYENIISKLMKLLVSRYPFLHKILDFKSTHHLVRTSWNYNCLPSANQGQQRIRINCTNLKQMNLIYFFGTIHKIKPAESHILFPLIMTVSIILPIWYLVQNWSTYERSY